MRNASRIMIDTLESRTLLSASPAIPMWHPPFTPSPTIQADQAAIKADLTKIRTDSKTWQTTISNDLKAIDTAYQALRTSKLNALYMKLHIDQAAAAPLLAADRMAIGAVYKKDEPAIDADYEAIKAAGTDATKLAAAKAQLAKDQATLKTDLAGPLAKLKADSATITADLAAIKAAITGDPALTAARNKLKLDQAAFEAALKPDFTQLKADELKLWSDIKAGK